MAAKMQIIATTRRLCKAKATRRSIIEEHSALYDHAIADLETALDHGLVALLETDLDRDGLESPRRHFDEHLIGIVFEHQSCRRYDRHRLTWGEERHIGEHAGLKPHGRVVDVDADLGAARVRIENIADEEDLAVKDLARIGSEDDIDRLPLGDQ